MTTAILILYGTLGGWNLSSYLRNRKWYDGVAAVAWLTAGVFFALAL